jgi:hypothetical protein
MNEQNNLHNSDHQSVIPYIHRRMGVVILLCVLFNSKVELV